MTVIGYLVSDYHAPSHSFVRREIAALRALGADIQPFSVRGEILDVAEAVPHILGRPAWFHLAAVAESLLLRPSRFFGGLRTALRHRPPGVRAVIWSLFHFVEAITLARLLSRSKVSHLHSHFANSGATVGLIAAKIAGIPWSLTLHGISETDYPAGLLLPEKLKTACFVASASLFMRAQAMRMTDPELWEKFHIVRCGIDLRSLPPKSERPAGSTFRIVCVGRLSAEKGYLDFVEALSILARDGRKFSVEIVGEGPSRQLIEGAIANSGLSQCITLLGALPERQTLECIARADTLVLPSLMEGLPVVLIEALGLHVPVAASRVAGVPELVEHDVTGLTFTPSDCEGMARAIALLIDSPALRSRLAEAGAQRVNAEFNIESSAKTMYNLFAEQQH